MREFWKFKFQMKQAVMESVYIELNCLKGINVTDGDACLTLALSGTEFMAKY